MVKPVITVDPGKKLREFIREAGRKVSDLTPVLILIGQYWRKSNASIFTLKSKGKYADLSEPYKGWKRSLLGSEYPIMLLHGRLMASITGEPSSESIQHVINKKSLQLGTSVPYANILQEGSKKNNLPARPVVMYGHEQVAPAALKTRIKIWEKMMLDFVAQRSGAK